MFNKCLKALGFNIVFIKFGNSAWPCQVLPEVSKPQYSATYTREPCALFYLWVCMHALCVGRVGWGPNPYHTFINSPSTLSCLWKLYLNLQPLKQLQTLSPGDCPEGCPPHLWRLLAVQLGWGFSTRLISYAPKPRLILLLVEDSSPLALLCIG